MKRNSCARRSKPERLEAESRSNRLTVGEDEMPELLQLGQAFRFLGWRIKIVKNCFNSAELSAEVVGQSRATEAVAKALRRSRADLSPNRFLYVPWATGVGKTLLAKSLAEKMFGEKDAIIQIDMSEYMEKFAVSRLVVRLLATSAMRKVGSSQSCSP